jgi:hypothetical protein
MEVWAKSKLSKRSWRRRAKFDLNTFVYQTTREFCAGLPKDVPPEHADELQKNCS